MEVQFKGQYFKPAESKIIGHSDSVVPEELRMFLPTVTLWGRACVFLFAVRIPVSFLQRHNKNIIFIGSKFVLFSRKPQ